MFLLHFFNYTFTKNPVFNLKFLKKKKILQKLYNRYQQINIEKQNKYDNVFYKNNYFYKNKYSSNIYICKYNNWIFIYLYTYSLNTFFQNTYLNNMDQNSYTKKTLYQFYIISKYKFFK